MILLRDFSAGWQCLDLYMQLSGWLAGWLAFPNDSLTDPSLLRDSPT